MNIKDMWNSKFPGWNRKNDGSSGRHYYVYPVADGTLRHHDVTYGMPIACRICGEVDRWKMEGDTGAGPRSFVCEHDPNEYASEMTIGVRCIASLPASELLSWEEVEADAVDYGELTWDDFVLTDEDFEKLFWGDSQ